MLAGVEHEDGTRSRVAIDAVFDSVSVATTFQEELAKVGVLFMPISEALQKQPELVKKYLGTVVPISDNFFATLNSWIISSPSFERPHAACANSIRPGLGEVSHAPVQHIPLTEPRGDLTTHVIRTSPQAFSVSSPSQRFPRSKLSSPDHHYTADSSSGS